MRDEEQRILDLLVIALRTSGKTKKEVDESRGWCRGTTSQLLKGRIDLKLRHMFDILEVAETSPEDFLRALFERKKKLDLPPVGLQEMIRTAARRHGLDPETAAADMDRTYGLDQPPPSVDQLVSMIETRLSALLAKHELEVEKKRRVREGVPKRAKPKAAGLS
ncbi:MAG TPA: hypothetical protein VGS22_09245 [Thermoanaerobaculia bacterium]|jgi:hypothetical protein|nr:hypothetical protein [Thermoanaerobaculia bacterium]